MASTSSSSPSSRRAARRSSFSTRFAVLSVRQGFREDRRGSARAEVGPHRGGAWPPRTRARTGRLLGAKACRLWILLLALVPASAHVGTEKARAMARTESGGSRLYAISDAESRTLGGNANNHHVCWQRSHAATSISRLAPARQSLAGALPMLTAGGMVGGGGSPQQRQVCDVFIEPVPTPSIGQSQRRDTQLQRLSGSALWNWEAAPVGTRGRNVGRHGEEDEEGKGTAG